MYIYLPILGPTDSTVPIGTLLNGMLVNQQANQNVVASTRCVNDRFQVTNPGGVSPPVICGQNTGEHSKYMDENN